MALREVTSTGAEKQTLATASPVSLNRLTPFPIRAFTVGNIQASQTANEANGFLFYIPSRVSITNFYHSVIVTGGNYDFGIYDTAFNAIWRYGSHATPAASSTTPIVVAASSGTPVTSPLVLEAGWYYFVSVADNVTCQFGGFGASGNGTSANRAGISGNATLDAKPVFWKKATSFPLPSSFASVSGWDYFSGSVPSFIMVDGL